MPTRLSVQRAAGRFSISYDLASLRSVKITVGKKDGARAPPALVGGILRTEL
jgi:hypothetical protein